MPKSKTTDYKDVAAKALYDAIQLIAESPASEHAFKVHQCRQAVLAIMEAYSSHMLEGIKNA